MFNFCESKAILKASFSKLEVMIDCPRNNPFYVAPCRISYLISVIE